MYTKSTLRAALRNNVLINGPHFLNQSFVELSPVDFDVQETAKKGVYLYIYRGEISSKNLVSLVWSPSFYFNGELSAPASIGLGDEQKLCFVFRPLNPQFDPFQEAYMVRMFVDDYKLT